MSVELPTSTLDFETARDAGGSAWERSDPRGALIERKSLFGWRVCLRDGEDAHTVAIAREEDEYLGWCDCDGWRYHSGPCAHLCTLRKADFVGAEDTMGQPVHVADVTEEFARPEGRL